jgi:hypothetical protein
MLGCGWGSLSEETTWEIKDRREDNIKMDLREIG